METKVCFKCGRELPIDSFYKHPSTADGHLNKCKDCAKKDVKQNYLTNSKSEDYMEKERVRGREKYNRLKYKTTEKGKEKKSKYAPASNAKRDLRISIPKTHELHHWNYNEPTNVFILERSLHHRLHTLISLNANEGIYYCGDEKLDSISKHYELIKKVCTDFGFDLSKVKVLRKE